MQPDNNVERLTVETVDRLTGGVRWPVDLPALYEQEGVFGPYGLYGESLDAFLKFHDFAPRQWEPSLQGVISAETNVVLVDQYLSRPRLRFVVAHELFHKVLGHCALLVLRPHEALARHLEMEQEASAHAVELLCPSSLFPQRLREVAPLGQRPTITDIRKVAGLFDVTLYTALRRHIGTDSLRSALITFSGPRNYKGQNPAHITMSVYVSKGWQCDPHAQRLLTPGRTSLSILTNTLAAFAALVLDENSAQDILLSESVFRKRRRASHGVAAVVVIVAGWLLPRSGIRRI